MKNKKNPAEFLGAKTLSPLEKRMIKGGMKHHVQCQGQYVVQQQQQQNENPSSPIFEIH